MRGTCRARAQRPGRRRGHREPRDRDRDRRPRRRGRRPRAARRGGRGDRLPRGARGRGAHARARSRHGAGAAPRRGPPHGAGRSPRDGGLTAIHGLARRVVRARDTCRLLVRRAVPPGGAAQRAARRRDHGHARLARHACRLVVVDDRAARRPPGRHLLRGGGRDHDADPARPLSRGARQAPLRCRHPRALRARRQGGARVARRRRGRPAGRAARGRRPVRREARREDRDRRRGRRRLLRRRPVDADRRIRAGRGRPRRNARRGDDQCIRSSRRPGNAGRQRHRARTDRTNGRAGPGGQGVGAAARRPDLRSLRPRGARGCPRDPRRLARRRCGRLDGVHGGGVGADHRVPVRTRTRDADRLDGRDRPRSTARHPAQGARGARADATSLDDRPRQDRHGHRGPAAARGRSGARYDPRGAAPGRRRGRGGERTSARPGDHRSDPGVDAGDGVPQPRGPRGRGGRRRAERPCRASVSSSRGRASS